MPMSRENFSAGIASVRQLGARILAEVDDEFNSIHKWCSDALAFVQLQDSPAGGSALFPKAVGNNNELSCKSLEISHQNLCTEDANLHTSFSTKSESSDVPMTDAVREIKRVPTRSSQRIKANSATLKNQVETANLDESSLLVTPKNSSADNQLIDPVKMNRRMPTRSSQRINANSTSLEKQMEEASSNDSSSVSGNSESSSVDLPIGGVRKKKPDQFQSSLQQIDTTSVKGTKEPSKSHGEKAGPLSTKHLKGTSSMTYRPGPAQTKALKGTPTVSEPRLAPKKLLKGTPTSSEPGLAPKKLLKGTPTSSEPGLAPKKLLKGTPTLSGGLNPQKLMKGTPTLSRAEPQANKLTGTPTSSRWGSALVFKGSAAMRAKVLPLGVKGGIPSKSDYVNQVAQEFSHLAKLKNLVNPDSVASSLAKPRPLVKHPRETFVIPPPDVKNATLVVGSSDWTHNSAEQEDQKELLHVAEPKDQNNLEAIALGSLMKGNQSVKDPRKTFTIRSFDASDAAGVIRSSDVPNSTFVVRSSDVGNATFSVSSSDVPNSTSVIHSSDVGNATFSVSSSNVPNSTSVIRSSDVGNATFSVSSSDVPNSTFVIRSSDVGNATFSVRSSELLSSAFVVGSSDGIIDPENHLQKGSANLVAHGLNQTIPVIKDPNATFDIASYDVTLDPDQRTPLPSKNEDDYGLDDVRSDESSDDESNPKKVVPKWAQAANRKSRLDMQYEVTQSQMFAFFESVKTTPDLTKLFSTSKIDRRILIRRSSAVWLSPETKNN